MKRKKANKEPPPTSGKRKKAVGEPPELARKPPAYRTVKTSLKSILRDVHAHQPRINDIVLRCNVIVTEAYQFIRLYCLYKYWKKELMPSLDEKFIRYCIKALGKRGKSGRKPDDQALVKELDEFHENEFKPLLAHKEKHDMENFSQLLNYLATQIHTGLHNNLQERFIN